MRLKKVKVQHYRSVIDSEEFEIDENKTILVGPNEAGKTVLLQAIQHLNPPEGVKPLSALRDYPRAHYNKISQGEVKASDARVAEAEFDLDDDDRAHLPEDFQKATYVLWRNLDNSFGHRLNKAPAKKRFSDIEGDLIRLAAHADQQFTAATWPLANSEGNQTLYTTHSPSAATRARLAEGLVGPDELDLVRVVEMSNRDVGTKVHTSVTAKDPAALLPLQEALGYDLAQSLFTQKRNLILEGLTDYWYIEAVAALLRDADEAQLNEKIALVPAQTAGKVVYYATILHAQGLKVAALLDSDNAGNQAAKQDTLVHTLGNKRILRTNDFMKTPIKGAEIEDLLRETLVAVAKNDRGWDISDKAATQVTRPIVDIFEEEVRDFSKYRLAKSLLRWSREHGGADLTQDERDQWSALIKAANAALK